MGIAKADTESRGGTFDDFFSTDAWLQAPGTAVQPTGTIGGSATWTGKVIAHNSNAGAILLRGEEIGGDARVTVNFAASPTVNVTLENLEGPGPRLVLPAADLEGPGPQRRQFLGQFRRPDDRGHLPQLREHDGDEREHGRRRLRRDGQDGGRVRRNATLDN